MRFRALDFRILKGAGRKTCERVKRMEKYMLVPEKVEAIEIVQDGKVVATIVPGEQEEK